MIRLVPDMPEHIYHADPCNGVPCLSQSTAHTLVCESPSKAYLSHPLLGAAPRKPTDEMEQGQAVHAMILGVGAGIVVIDAKDYKAKHPQEMAAIAREAGKVPLLAAKHASLEVAVEVIRAKLIALGFFLDGQSEVSAFWEEIASDGTIVQCKARFDHLIAPRILDVKWTADANPTSLPRHMVDFGYDIQDAAYRSAMRAVLPEFAGREDMIFLFAEKTAPYAVTPLECAGSMRQLGEIKWRRAIDTWAQCLKSGVWPDYTTETVRAEAPTWELNRWLAA